MPKCDICELLDAVIDGKTVFGPWAYMCKDCHDEVGVGLGIGRGQYIKGGKSDGTAKDTSSRDRNS